jgi:hypothetical protein
MTRALTLAIVAGLAAWLVVRLASGREEPRWELFDFDTGNLLADFRTRRMAERWARAALPDRGRETVHLLRVDDTGCGDYGPIRP